MDPFLIDSHNPMLCRDLQILIGEKIVDPSLWHYLPIGIVNFFVCPLMRQAAIRQLTTLNMFKMDRQIAKICSESNKKRFIQIDFRRRNGYELLERLVALMVEHHGEFFSEIHLFSTWEIDVDKLIGILCQLKGISLIRLPNNVQLRPEEKQLAKLMERSMDSVKCVHNICCPWSIPAKIRTKLNVVNSKLWPIKNDLTVDIRRFSIETSDDQFTKSKSSSSAPLIELSINFNLAPLNAFENVLDAIKRVHDQYQVDLAKVVQLKLFDKWAPSAQCATELFESFVKIFDKIKMPSLEMVDLEMARLVCVSAHEIEQGLEQQQPTNGANISFLLGTCRCLSRLASFALKWFNSNGQHFSFRLNVSVRLCIELRCDSTDHKKLMEAAKGLAMANVCPFWADAMGEKGSANVSRAVIPLEKVEGMLQLSIEIRPMSNSIGKI